MTKAALALFAEPAITKMRLRAVESKKKLFLFYSDPAQGSASQALCSVSFYPLAYGHFDPKRLFGPEATEKSSFTLNDI
jgi:hypothetical protein